MWACRYICVSIGNAFIHKDNLFVQNATCFSWLESIGGFFVCLYKTVNFLFTCIKGCHFHHTLPSWLDLYILQNKCLKWKWWHHLAQTWTRGLLRKVTPLRTILAHYSDWVDGPGVCAPTGCGLATVGVSGPVACLDFLPPRASFLGVGVMGALGLKAGSFPTL